MSHVYLEIAPKRAFACSVEWPGWCRSGRDEGEALERLADYADRYAPVVARAGFELPKTAVDFDVVERKRGSASTDFGALDGPAIADDRRLTKAQAERLAAIVEASWATLDDVAAQSPPMLRKGPRGGGRDRDKMLQHVLAAEVSYIRKVGLKIPEPSFDDRAAIAAERAAVLEVLRAARQARAQAVGHVVQAVAVSLHRPPHRVARPRPRLGDGGPSRGVTATLVRPRLASSRTVQPAADPRVRRTT